MDTFSESDFSKLKKEHDDLVEQNRLVDIRLEQGIDSLLEFEAEITTLRKQEEANLKKIEQLEKDTDVCRAVENLKEMLQLVREEQAFARAERADNARCAEYLASMIDQAEERAAKRPRV